MIAVAGSLLEMNQDTQENVESEVTVAPPGRTFTRLPASQEENAESEVTVAPSGRTFTRFPASQETVTDMTQSQSQSMSQTLPLAQQITEGCDTFSLVLSLSLWCHEELFLFSLCGLDLPQGRYDAVGINVTDLTTRPTNN